MSDGDDLELTSVLSGKTPASILFLHGQMMPLWFFLATTGGRPVVSMSRDGERLVQLLRSIGYDNPIRGSSSSGGREVLQEMTETLQSSSILVTPDGPRGPSGEVKAGGVVSAARANRRILALSWSTDRSIRFNSWDRMEIPLPFSRVYIRYCIIRPHTIENSIQSLGSWYQTTNDEV